jgi:hypothetical protein
VVVDGSGQQSTPAGRCASVTETAIRVGGLKNRVMDHK